jgi:hypothetical protein
MHPSLLSFLCRVLSGSVQFGGFLLFPPTEEGPNGLELGSLLDLPRIQELFAPLSRVPNSLVAALGEGTMRLPCYLAQPVLLVAPEEGKLQWTGRLPLALPPTITGTVFCIQSLVAIQIQFTAPDTPIQTATKTVPLRICPNPLVPLSCAPLCTANILPEFTVVADDPAVPKEAVSFKRALPGLKKTLALQRRDRDIQEACRHITKAADVQMRIREGIEAAAGPAIVSVRAEGIAEPFATVEMRRTELLLGGKLVGAVRFHASHVINRVRVALETIEIVKPEALAAPASPPLHLVTIIRQQVHPCQGHDRVDFVMGLPVTGVDGSFECDLFGVQWRLRVSLCNAEGEYEVALPLTIHALP